VQNRLMMAKLHLQLRDRPAHREWLEAALALPVVTAEDRADQKEAEALLQRAR
jgi:hypothetical protein